MTAVLQRAWLVVLVGAALPARAQAPRISPEGDPSVRSDTIYALAVQAVDHPDEDFVYLLDDGVIRLEADGRGTRTYRQVVQILTREAAERWGEQSFSDVSGRERLTLNWVRVLQPNGTVISAQPAHEQESIAAVAREAPVYSDAKVRRISIGGIAPGTLLDYSYTVETLQPLTPGDFEYSWRVTTGRLTRRSRYIVDVPASFNARIKEMNLTFPRRSTQVKGRRVYVWATREVPKLEREPFAADSNGIDQYIRLAAPLGWGDVAQWYGRLSRDRYAVTPALDSSLAAAVKGAGSLQDSLRAVHRWVAQDFRYVSLSLGIGGYQPRLPGAVLDTRYGDCKDKATLFIALAERMGLKAYPVLLSASGGIARDLPTAHAFDHMIAAVERPAGYLYLDLTSELTPFGSLPPAEQGEFGLVVRPDGSGEEITFPADSVTANRDVSTLVGELTPDGAFRGRLVHVATGDQQYALRRTFATEFGPLERDRFTRAMASVVFPGARGDSLELFDGRDLRAEPRVALVVSGAQLASKSGTKDILTLPLRNYGEAKALVSDLQARGPRRFPIDAAEVAGPHEETAELSITLPVGWRAELPPNVAASSVFGTYTAQYAQAGRVLHVVRRLVGRKGTEPPERIGQLIAWLTAMGADDVRYLVLEHP
jgi:transglutaminase-like putative cysteine protease